MLENNSESKMESAYRKIQKAIVHADYLPGKVLKLAVLSSEFSVGLTPIREALTRLTAEHLVCFSNNRGFRVAGASESEMSEVSEALILVEVSLLKKSIEMGDITWESNVVAAHHKLSRCVPAFDALDADPTAWDLCHQAFHAALVEGANSPWLSRFRQQLIIHQRRHQNIIRKKFLEATTPDQLKNSLEFRSIQKELSLAPHTELMNVTLERKAPEAAKLLKAHIELTKRIYLDVSLCKI